MFEKFFLMRVVVHFDGLKTFFPWLNYFKVLAPVLPVKLFGPNLTFNVAVKVLLVFHTLLPFHSSNQRIPSSFII